jgi:hypothetical protein
MTRVHVEEEQVEEQVEVLALEKEASTVKCAVSWSSKVNKQTKTSSHVTILFKKQIPPL